MVWVGSERWKVIVGNGCVFKKILDLFIYKHETPYIVI